MSLDALAESLAQHLIHDPDETALWFSSLENPARLMLPEDGLPLGDILKFVNEFLKEGFGFEVPDGFEKVTALEAVSLTRLEVEYAEADPDSGDSGGIGLFIELRLDTEWHLEPQISGLGDALALMQPHVSIGRAAEGGGWSLGLSGTVKVLGAEFHATADWPGKVFTANYIGPPVDVADVLKDVGLPTAGLAFQITEMAVSANCGADSYSATLGIGALKLGTLGLNRARISIDSVAKAPSAALSGVFTVPGLAVNMAAHFGAGGLRFSGRGRPTKKDLGLGQLVESLMGALSGGVVSVDIPDALDQLHVHAVEIEFDTADHSHSVLCEVGFAVDGREMDLGFRVSVDGEGTQRPGGYVRLGKTRFDLQLERPAKGAEGADIFAASYVPGTPFTFHLHDDVLKHVAGGEALIDVVPDLSLTLKGATFARVTDRQTQQTAQIVGVAMDAGIDLTKLPLIGGLAGNALAGAGVDNLQVLMSTGPVTAGALEALNAVLAADPEIEDPFQIPATKGADPDGPALAKGLAFAGDLTIGSETQGIILGGGSDDGAADTAVDPKLAAADAHARANPDTATSPAPAPAGDATWLSVQKQLGPLYVDKLGFAYRKAELWLMPSATLSLSGLTISLDGLAVSSPLDQFSPTFHLLGLGLDYRSGAVEIGGAFQRIEHEGQDEYYGSAVLKTATLALSAMGAYSRVGGEPSMFIYLDLDYPLGGPPFFFVTGLTAGFGYNRALKVPGIETLDKFPFVAAALGNRPKPTGAEKSLEPGDSVDAVRSAVASQIEGLRDYVFAEKGQNWLAAGVHFTSFEIVKGFALLSVAFGHKTEIHLLGAATFEYPPVGDAGGAPLSRIDVVVDATYLPDEGTLEVGARIAPGSYVFEPSCQLSGSMAFKTWFKGPHKNDFVLTIGGYHPDFHIPANYPTAQRLAFNWHKSDALNIKGQLYFAMTPNYLMAGGALDATWESGALKAWLKISADFLIRYKPFHYDARMSINIGAQVTIHFFGTHHISAHFGADLHVWGPSFSGTASFDIWICSFSVSFGDGAGQPPALTWDQFHAAFLPKDDPLISIGVERGLVRAFKRTRMTDDFSVIRTENDSDEHWMIDPYHLALTIGFVVPTNAEARVGVAPMDLRREMFHSTPDIAVLFGDQKIDVTVEEFTRQDIRDHSPAGLWGNRYDLDPGSQAIVDDTVAAVRLIPGKPPLVGDPTKIDRDVLAFETEDMLEAFAWAPGEDLAATGWATLGTAAGESTEEPDLEGRTPDFSARDALLAGFFDAKDLAALSGTLSGADLMRRHKAEART